MDNPVAWSSLVLPLFLMLLLLLWMTLPFAIFGVKSRLDKILLELQKSNRPRANSADAEARHSAETSFRKTLKRGI